MDLRPARPSCPPKSHDPHPPLRGCPLPGGEGTRWAAWVGVRLAYILQMPGPGIRGCPGSVRARIRRFHRIIPFRGRSILGIPDDGTVAHPSAPQWCSKCRTAALGCLFVHGEETAEGGCPTHIRRRNSRGRLSYISKLTAGPRSFLSRTSKLADRSQSRRPDSERNLIQAKEIHSQP